MAPLHRGERRRALMISGTKERVERAMGVTMQREMERLEKRMTFLANTGSARPSSGCSARSGAS
jgi:biopolymer transport protein TolQ